MFCTNCASDLPSAYPCGLMYGETFTCCSGRCVAELFRVWAPSRRVMAWRPLLALVAVVVMALL